MFKLVVLSGLLAVALAKPSTLVPPTRGKLVSEKTTESHGNSVIPAAVPVLASEHVAPVGPPVGPPVIGGSPLLDQVILLPNKTILEPPIVETGASLDSLVSTTTLPPLPTLLPVGLPQTKPLEKLDKLPELAEKSESSQQKKQLMEKMETLAQQSSQLQSQEKVESLLKPSSDLLKKNETLLHKELPGKTKTQRQIIIHQAAPAVLTYQAAGISNIVPPPPVFVPIGIPPYGELVLNSTTDLPLKLPSDGKLKSAESKQQSAEGSESVENGVIQEVATGVHVAAAPVYYYPYPAAVIAEKSISSYGHSIIHGV